MTAISRAISPAANAVSMGSILAFDVPHEAVHHFVLAGFGVYALGAVQDPCVIHEHPVLPKDTRQAVIRGCTVSRESVAADGK